MIIKLYPETLMDGSIVYDVAVGAERFHCVDEKSAIAFVSTVAAAIDTYTVDEAAVE